MILGYLTILKVNLTYKWVKDHLKLYSYMDKRSLIDRSCGPTYKMWPTKKI